MVAGTVATSKIAKEISDIPARISNKAILKRANRLTQETNKIKDSGKITSKLLGEAKSRGIDILNDPDLPTSYGFYQNSKRDRDRLARKLKKLRRQGKLEEARRLREESGLITSRNFKNGSINLQPSDNSPASLAHEIGHSDYHRHGRKISRNPVGKLAHKRTGISNFATGPGGVKTSAAIGFAGGVNSERAKQRGEKEGKVNKLLPRLLPVAAVAPMLINEGKASARGLRIMKKLGASPELMKAGRKELEASWGTYATVASRPIISSELGRLAGKGYGKLTKSGNNENTKKRR